MGETRTPVENMNTPVVSIPNDSDTIATKLAALEQETSTLAEKIASNSDKIFHEAVIATLSVSFLVVLIMFGACRLNLFSKKSSNNENFAGKRTVSRENFPRTGSLTIGSLMDTFNS